MSTTKDSLGQWDRYMNRVPFSRSYWVVPGKFLAGCYPGSRSKDRGYKKLRALLEDGIRRVISLMEPDEKDWSGKSFMSYEVQMTSIAKSMDHTVNFDTMPIKDAWIPSRPEMCRILDRIDQNMQDQRPVYIHCWGGRGRTSTVVGCYLARHGMATGQNVFDRIKELRRNTEDHWITSPETSEQVDMVLSWVEAE
jgi:predicted protein tyrosine phosphatase